MFLLLPIGDENKYKGIPYITYSIFAINVIIYLFYTFSMPAGEYRIVVEHYGFNPAHPQLSALVTSTFFHSDFFHIFFNMAFLLVFADNVEILLGPVLFTVMYLAWGAFACIAQAIANPAMDVPMIGASGAIAGVLGAYIYLMPRNRIKIFYWFFLVVDIILIKSFWVLGMWFMLQL